MKNSTAVILIVIGLVVMIWGAYGFQTREKVIDLGPIEATKTTTHHVPYAPIMGGVILIGGIAILVSSRKG